jgi:pimeloyl-ACP methyl ester carboxylesterase
MFITMKASMVGTVVARTGNVAYETRGQGPPLILLHANGLDRTSYDAVIPVLSRTHRTIAIDWPGMGDSDAPAGPRTATASLMADVLEDVIAALGVGPAVIVGNSIGGFAAARLASRHPEHVRALVLVDSGGFATEGAVARAFCWLKGKEWVTRRFERRFAARYLVQRTPHVAEILRRVEAAHRIPSKVAVNAAIWRSFAGSESDLRDAARSIRCPTLLVWGRHDPVVRAAVDGRTAASVIAGAHLVELETGHCPFAEDPDAFLAAVQPFLDDLSPADALPAEQSP